MTQADGELVVTQEAIDTIAGAYEQAALELRELAIKFAHDYGREPWGTLPSILQLQRMYEELALGATDSAVVRLNEFAEAAEELATWVRRGGALILDADHATATALSESGSR
ncbi:hypothetical protein [Tomitella fengzijianii]|uniref:Uncharacterized protein n=1 Tax=Tomitella fengzijianii TaxID=2597660 RepID=A0A516WZG3_9ACTN|nr:hypothetical protein [Tomitella fengzijianii]QDQ96212.1 hypothetical protein FO059_01215 [Tomitella fengzijianii]